MAEAFIFLHLPPAFLHCFFVPASEISDPSALTQWRLAFANAAGAATRANAAIRASFIQFLLGRMCCSRFLRDHGVWQVLSSLEPTAALGARPNVCEGNPTTRKAIPGPMRKLGGPSARAPTRGL